MIEMKYKLKREDVILDEGEYKGYRYKIISYGIHPCSYIALPKGHKYAKIDEEYDISLPVHGGITYKEDGDGIKFDKKYCWIGWDYAHGGDFSGYDMLPLIEKSSSFYYHDKKWTTEELINEVKEAIEELCE